jgi:hypothetical protein
MKKQTKVKPQFGKWIDIKATNFYPPLQTEVIVCRANQGKSFSAFRVKDKLTKEIYWTNAVWNYQPIPPSLEDSGITHWMPMPDTIKTNN